MSSRDRKVLAGIIGTVLVVGLVYGWSLIGLQYISITSGSMEPTLSVGSRLIVKPVDVDELRPTDIITFRDPDGDGRITHTYGGKADDGSLLTKGDANPTPDEFVQPLRDDHVIGKVVHVVPYFTTEFWLSLRGVIIIVAAGVIVWGLRKQSDQEVDKTEDLESSLNPA